MKLKLEELLVVWLNILNFLKDNSPSQEKYFFKISAQVIFFYKFKHNNFAKIMQFMLFKSLYFLFS